MDFPISMGICFFCKNDNGVEENYDNYRDSYGLIPLITYNSIEIQKMFK